MTTQKIDIHNSDAAFERAIRKLKISSEILPQNRELIVQFLDDCALGKSVHIRHRTEQGRRISGHAKSGGNAMSIRSRQRYLYYLVVVAKYFRTLSFNDIRTQDVESFILSLDTNNIKKALGEAYADKSKSNMKKTLIIFLRWLFSEQSNRYYDATFWIDTRFKTISKPCLDETQIRKLLSKCLSIKEKVLIAVLFDGGMRIEEFLNIRFSDVTCVEGEAPYYRMKVREEFSKTAGRDIPFFWMQSYDIIKEWMDFLESDNLESPFYECSYSAVQAMLKRIGLRAGIPRVHAHLFRHTSATYFANQGWNEFQLNKKYGWSAKSDMGRHYVEQAKINIENEKRVKEYEDMKLGGVRQELSDQQKENQLLRSNQESMKLEHENFKQNALALEAKFASLMEIAKQLEGNKNEQKKLWNTHHAV